VTDAGNWEQVHLMHATAGDIASTGDDEEADGAGNPARCRTYQTGHVENGDGASHSLIFKRLVSLDPWVKL
jgi:hypothetical protein